MIKVPLSKVEAMYIACLIDADIIAFLNVHENRKKSQSSGVVKSKVGYNQAKVLRDKIELAMKEE